MKYEAFRSKTGVDDCEWRVEAIDELNEGVCYVAIFSGPDAKARAQEYARFKNETVDLELESVRN